MFGWLFCPGLLLFAQHSTAVHMLECCALLRSMCNCMTVLALTGGMCGQAVATKTGVLCCCGSLCKRRSNALAGSRQACVAWQVEQANSQDMRAICAFLVLDMRPLSCCVSRLHIAQHV
jgi:hypothetical protein